MIANRSGYPALPCAAFDAKNPAVANVLWLFYISKVRAIVAGRRLPLVGWLTSHVTAGYDACVAAYRQDCFIPGARTTAKCMA